MNFVGEGSETESNKEHLIGREFVPTGAFGDGNQFNFIFRACKKCNDEKSNVERHISTVTLFNSLSRESSQAHNDLAQRKAEKDYHPTRRGTLIKDSGYEFKINKKLGSTVNVCYTVSVPPQPEQSYIKFLAFRHIQGIFSLLTSKDRFTDKGTYVLNQKCFYLHGFYFDSDWNNPQLLEIMKRAQEVECYKNIETANGFFKVIMRRKQNDSGAWWFWALEWNKSLRIVGAIALPKNIPDIFVDLPNLELKHLGDRNDGAIILSYRESIPFDQKSDTLFHC